MISQKLKVLSRSIVFNCPEKDPYDQANRYGFNHAPSVVTLPDGRLLCAWFSGPFEASLHQVILGALSSDDGRTWSKASIIQNFLRRSDFDPAFIADGNRTWLFFTAGRHNRYPFVKDENTVGPRSWYIYYRYTDNSGRTWSEPVELFHMNGCRSNGIKLSTGELLLPNQLCWENPPKAGVVKSTDGGKTWNVAGQLTCAAGADEPTIAELKSGEILIALRTNDGYLWMSISSDKGDSWTAPIKTDIQAASTSHNLFRISDGLVVLTHNENTVFRTPLTMRITEDGKSWGKPLMLDECPIPKQGDPVWARQVTYPSVTETTDKTLVIVWADITYADYKDYSEQFGIIRSARVSIID